MTEPQKLEAIPIKAFEGHTATDDGQHALFKFSTLAGDFVIAYPTKNLSSLLKGVAAEHAKAADAPRMSSRTVQPMRINWYEMGLGPQKQFVLSLRLESGGFLSFELPSGMPEQMQETLHAMVRNEPISPPPGTVVS